jgi:vanillate O-demethylase ferredoxin subunit
VVSSNEDGSLITISVLLTATTRGGCQFMHGLRVGDTMLTTQPLQNFPLRIGAERYAVVAGGIGITAVLDMAAVLKALQADYTFLYAARSAGAAYLPELRAAHGGRLVVHLDEDGSSLDVPTLIAGVAEGRAPHSTELYMCGPIRLMDAVRRQWLSSQLPIYHLRYETFGNSGWFEPEEFVVRIPRLGLETTIGTHTTILEALTDAGADLMFDYRKGECGLCTVNVLRVDGVLDHRDVFLSDGQRAAGRKLCTCVSRACRARRPVDQKPTFPRHRHARAASNRPGFPSSPSTSPDPTRSRQHGSLPQTHDALSPRRPSLRLGAASAPGADLGSARPAPPRYMRSGR